MWRPVGEAFGLPGRVYADPSVYELERRTLFTKTWVAATVASELPNPGDVFPVQVAGWPLVLVRDENGEINGFHNICRHRGATVVTKACTVPVLRCPWHGWNYALDGALKGTPEFGGVGKHAVDIPIAEQRLAPVRVEQWFDILFVNIDGNAPPLEEYLSAFLTRFAGVDFSAMKRGGDWETSYPCNWKLAIESGIEDYHLPFLHPSITDGASRGERSYVEARGNMFLVAGISKDMWSAGRSTDNLPILPSIVGLNGDDASSLFFMNLFPSAVLGIVPNSMYIALWLPEGHESTRLRFYHYFCGDGALEEQFKSAREHVIKNVQTVFLQDVSVVASVQAGMTSRDELNLRTCFSPFWETGVLAFQRAVVAAVGGASDQ